MAAVRDVKPHRQFHRQPKAIGEWGDRDLAMRIAQRIARHKRSMDDGSYLFADRAGYVVVMSESSLTVPAYLAAHEPDLVGLYGTRGRPAPSAGDIAGDLDAHYQHQRFRARRLAMKANP